MPVGRCAGCGFTDSGNKANIHVVSCQEYVTLFRTQPERCLDPVAEYERYRTEDHTPEARAGRRDQRLLQRFEEMDRQQLIHADRWQTPKGILDD